MRTIDADALETALIPKWNCMGYQQFACKAVWDEIKNAPTIEPERKRGKWIQVQGLATPGGDPVWCCSECGKGVHVADGLWVACPNCGADMRGEQDETC